MDAKRFISDVLPEKKLGLRIGFMRPLKCLLDIIRSERLEPERVAHLAEIIEDGPNDVPKLDPAPVVTDRRLNEFLQDCGKFARRKISAGEPLRKLAAPHQRLAIHLDAVRGGKFDHGIRIIEFKFRSGWVYPPEPRLNLGDDDVVFARQCFRIDRLPSQVLCFCRSSDEKVARLGGSTQCGGAGWRCSEP